jgi:hypothetical protein
MTSSHANLTTPAAATNGETGPFTTTDTPGSWGCGYERPSPVDVTAVRELLDLMADFPDNDQRARYLLTCNWMRDHLASHGAEPAGSGRAENSRRVATAVYSLRAARRRRMLDLAIAHGAGLASATAAALAPPQAVR